MKHKVVLLLALFALVLVAVPVLAQVGVNRDDGIDMDEARTIALAQFPGTSVVAVERTVENRTLVWDVKLDNGMAVYVSAQTGAIVKMEPWRGVWNGLARSQFVAPMTNTVPTDIGTDGVDVDEAQTIALSFYPDAAVVAIDLERENGIDAWDVMLDNGMAVYINAVTGAVIEFESWTDTGLEANGNDGVPPWAGLLSGRRAWETQQGSTTGSAAVSGSPVTRSQATQIALAQFPGTRMIDIGVGIEYGRLVWDVELNNGVSVYIEQATGNILKMDGPGRNWENPRFAPDRQGATTPPVEGGITRYQAIQIALAQFPGTRVIDVETGTEYGIRVWDIELSNGVSVEIDMTNGDIVEIWGGSTRPA